MIKKTVYFRTQEDLDKFDAIKNKAEWLHEHLSVDILKNRVNNQEVFVVNRPPKPIKQVIDETNQAVVESLGNSEVIAALNAKLDNVKEKFISEHPLTNARTDGEPEGLDAIINDPKYEPMEDV